MQATSRQAALVALIVGAATAIMQALLGDAAFRIAAGCYGYDLMDAAAAAAVRQELGLDRPLAVQLGTDHLGRDMAGRLLAGAKLSLSLAGLSVLTAAVPGSALGVLMAGPRLPGALSGGMAQRVAFAAAKAGGAPLVIADEPTKGLDADRAETVTALLKRVPDAGGALLTITHDLRLARRLGGAVVFLKDGAVVETGPAETVLANPSSGYARALLAAEPSAWTLPPAVVRGESVLRAENLTVGREVGLVRDFELELLRSERTAIADERLGKTSLRYARGRAGGRVKRAGLPDTAVQKLYQDPPAAFPERVRGEHPRRMCAEGAESTLGIRPGTLGGLGRRAPADRACIAC